MTSKSSRWGFLSIFTIMLLVLFGSTGMAPAMNQPSETAQASQVVLDQCLENSSITHQNKLDGLYTFIGTNPDGERLKLPDMEGASSPEAAGRSYLSTCGSLFGLKDPGEELVTRKQGVTEDGRNVLLFQQTHKGIPVLAGELKLQLTANNEIILVNGEISPDLTLDVIPTLSTGDAQQAALAAVSLKYQLVTPDDLTTDEPELWIYDPQLIGNTGSVVLAWRMKVLKDSMPPLEELVLVNARDGSLALSLGLLESAKSIETYDAKNGTDYAAAELVCDTTDLTCAAGDSDEQEAHVFASDTYDYYFNTHNRDSIDNAGMTIKSYVHFDTNWCNAQWVGSSSLMRYGDGCDIVGDDVVAHELTHGVTDYESNLVYSGQSGAINESFSDIWGEFVDLNNGRGTDTPEARWKIGEDIYTVIRNMKNPPAKSHPDRMGSALYYTGTDQDIYVHRNSGVGNKAAYLMTDGDTFNSYTVTGLGETKAIKIFYEAQTNILTSGNDYAALGNALIQACSNLVAGGTTTTADCTQVAKAVYATEMLIEKPALNSPSGNLKDRTPGFSWQKVANATSYQLQVKDGWFTVYTKTVNPAACGAANCTNTPTNALGYKTYKWKVRAQINGSKWGPWSPENTITVKKPVGVAPAGTIYDKTPLYKWTKEDGASQYQIELKDGFFVKYTATAGAGSCGTTYCSFTPATVLELKTYTWKVRALDSGSSAWGDWSDAKTFTVANAPAGFNSTFTSNADGWTVHKGQWTVVSGNYKAFPAPDPYIWSSVSHSGTYSKLTYEARMKLTGCSYWCTAHLSIRGTPTPLDPDGRWNKEYKFVYATDGYFAVFKVNPTLTVLQGWTYSSYILPTDYNTIKVTASGTTLNFYINGHLVWSGTDSSLSSGRVGIAYLGDTGNLLVDWAKLSATVADVMDEVIPAGEAVPGSVDNIPPARTP